MDAKDRALNIDDIIELLHQIEALKKPCRLELNIDGGGGMTLYVTKMNLELFKEIF